MRFERVALRKSSSADVAHVRPFAGVNSDVTAKLELKKNPNLKLKNCAFSHKDEIFRDGLTGAKIINAKILIEIAHFCLVAVMLLCNSNMKETNCL